MPHLVQREKKSWRDNAARQAQSQLQKQSALFSSLLVSHTFIHGFLSPAVNLSAAAFLTTSEAAGMGLNPTFLNWDVYPLSMGDPSTGQHLRHQMLKMSFLLTTAPHIQDAGSSARIQELFIWHGHVYIFSLPVCCPSSAAFTQRSTNRQNCKYSASLKAWALF